MAYIIYVLIKKCDAGYLFNWGGDLNLTSNYTVHMSENETSSFLKYFMLIFEPEIAIYNISISIYCAPWFILL